MDGGVMVGLRSLIGESWVMDHILPSILWYYWSTFFLASYTKFHVQSFVNSGASKTWDMSTHTHTPLAWGSKSQVVNQPGSLPVLKKKNNLEMHCRGVAIEHGHLSSFVKSLHFWFFKFPIIKHQSPSLIWLVVDVTLWKIWKSVGMMIIPEKTCSKPPARNHHHYPLAI